MTQKTQELRRMFKVGSGFWKGSKILSNYLGKTKDSDLNSPILVNISFAGEIYLKCLLLVHEGDYPKCHDLKRLFDELPKPDQTAIADAYKNNFKNSPLFRFLVKPKSIPKLRSVLAGAAETFSKVRYSFEPGKKSPGPTVGLQEFVEALQQWILVTKPELAVALDVSGTIERVR